MRRRTAAAITLILAASVGTVITAAAAPGGAAHGAATLPAATAPYRIGFSRLPPGATVRSIFSTAADGSDAQQNTNSGQLGSDLDPTYSPDGTKLAYSEIIDPNTRLPRRAIVLANADGSNAHQVTTPDASSTDNNATWSPDGSMIAFDRLSPPSIDSGPSTHQILILSVATGQVIGTLQPDLWSDMEDPAWSPTDPGTIVTSASPNGSNDHVIVRVSVTVSGGTVTAGGVIPLTTNTSCQPPSQINDLQVASSLSLEDYDAALSPDGGTVAYLSNFARPATICLVNIDGTNPRPVPITNLSFAADSETTTARPAFSPDGAVLALEVDVPATGQSILAVTFNALPATATSATQEAWIGNAAMPAFDVKGGPVSLTVVATPTPGYVGGTPIAVVYTVRNQTTQTIGNVALAATLPAGLPIASSSPAGCMPTACVLGDVPPGGTAVATFQLTTKLAVSSLATGAITFTKNAAAGNSVTGQGPVVVIEPAMTLNPAVGPPGFVTVVTGLGFPPKATVRFHWDVGITALTRVKVKADGTFTAQMLILPNDVIGDRNLIAHGITGPTFGDVSKPFLVVLGSPEPPRLLGRN